MITLRLATLQANARQALKEGRLGIQHPELWDLEKTGGTCRYRYGNTNVGCGIGVSLPDDVARAWDDRLGSSAIREILNDSHPKNELYEVDCLTAEEDAIKAIQYHHDLLITSYAPFDGFDAAYKQFLDTIDWQVDRDGEPPVLPRP